MKKIILSLILLIALSGCTHRDVNITVSSDGKVSQDESLFGDGFYSLQDGPTLESLNDVALFGLATDDILQYDGAEWVNIPESGLSIVETDPIWIASSTDYYTSAEVDAGFVSEETDPIWNASSSDYNTTAEAEALYVNITGDTMTGILNLATTTTVGPLSVGTTTAISKLTVQDNGQYLAIDPDSNSTIKWTGGSLNLSGDDGVNDGTTVNITGKGTGFGQFQVVDGDTSGAYTILSNTSITDINTSNNEIRYNKDEINFDFRYSHPDDNYLFMIDGSGNAIGIGESSPSAKLDINGNLEINNNNTVTDPTGISLNNGSNGSGLYINQTATQNASARPLTVYSNSAQTNTELVLFRQNNASSNKDALQIINVGSANGIEVLNTGAGAAAFIDQNGNGAGLSVDTAGSGDSLLLTSNGTGRGLVIDQNNNNVALNLVSDATTAGPFAITASALTSGMGFNLYSNSAGFSSSNGLQRIFIDNASATGRGLHVRNDGTGNGIFLDQNGNGGALLIDSEATTGIALNVNGDKTTTSYMSRFDGDNLTSGSAALFRTESSGFTSQNGVIQVQATNAGSSGRVINVFNGGTGDGILVDQNGNGSAIYIDSEATSATALTVNGQNSSGLLVDFNENGTSRFAIDHQGYVGIGDSTPASTLEVNGGITPGKVTSDPCASTGYQEGSLFYNDTSNYFCYCDGTNDVQMHSPATACF